MSAPGVEVRREKNITNALPEAVQMGFSSKALPRNASSSCPSIEGSAALSLRVCLCQ